jgi:hypothetical protein
MVVRNIVCSNAARLPESLTYVNAIATRGRSIRKMSHQNVLSGRTPQWGGSS